MEIRCTTSPRPLAGEGRVEGRKHRPPELRPQAEAHALVVPVPLERVEGPLLAISFDLLQSVAPRQADGE